MSNLNLFSQYLTFSEGEVFPNSKNIEDYIVSLSQDPNLDRSLIPAVPNSNTDLLTLRTDLDLFIKGQAIPKSSYSLNDQKEFKNFKN